jgi:transcriptional regulator of acetoin/glycerol metabolism
MTPRTKRTPRPALSYLKALQIVDAHEGTTRARDYLRGLAKLHRGNRRAMAESAGVSVATLYRALREVDLPGVVAVLP